MTKHEFIYFVATYNILWSLCSLLFIFSSTVIKRKKENIATVFHTAFIINKLLFYERSHSLRADNKIVAEYKALIKILCQGVFMRDIDETIFNTEHNCKIYLHFSVILTIRCQTY